MADSVDEFPDVIVVGDAPGVHTGVEQAGAATTTVVAAATLLQAPLVAVTL